MTRTIVDVIRDELKKTESPAKIVARLQKRGIWRTEPEVWRVRKDERLNSAAMIKSHADLIRLALDLRLAAGFDKAKQLITVATEIVEYIERLRP